MIVALSFFASLALFTAIGVFAMKQRKTTTEDYLVAGRSVPAWLTALSSVATNNSGFMFVGLIGFAYGFGVQAVWLQLGWVLGDVWAWYFVHGRVRERSGRLRLTTVPLLVGTDDEGRRDSVVVRLASLLSLIFLCGYAAAQLRAGSTALHGLFGWDMWVGAVLGAIIVALYSYAGGLRASIWTDAAQAMVMLVSMLMLVGAAASEVGGPIGLLAALDAQDASLVQWFPQNLTYGFSLYLLGFIFGGMGIVGQPHILVRSMALVSEHAIPRTRAIYFAWYLPFSVMAVAAGLYARVIIPDLEALASAQLTTPAELALPALSKQLLPEVFIGLMLAGLFSATMSTADSQILSCSAAITQDIVPRWDGSYRASKIATLSIAVVALVLAVFANDGVFSLVLSAWSALAATLGPVLLLRLYNRPVSRAQALAMIGTGFAVQYVWRALGLAGAIFELLPAMLLPFVLYGFMRAVTKGKVVHADPNLPS